jgi:hypothetical protein
MMKPGTRVETRGCPAMGGFPAVPPEKGTVVKPLPNELPLPGDDWNIVCFDAGGGLCIHNDSLRVIP